MRSAPSAKATAAHTVRRAGCGTDARPCDGTGFRPFERVTVADSLEATWKVTVAHYEKLLGNHRDRESELIKENGELRAELVNKTRFRDGT